MKQKFLNFINTYKRYSIAVVYAIIACIILSNRNAIVYSHMPIIQNFPIVIKILDVVFSLLILTGFITLVKTLYCPPHLKKRFQLAVERAELHTGKNEYPQLVSVKKDITRKHQRIFKINHKGIRIGLFDDKIADLEGTLKGKIGQIEPCRNHSHILMSVMPFRYVKPTIIDLDFYRIIQQPNMLIVGKTGSGKSYAMSVILGIYAKYIPDVAITACDYKNSSFTHLSDTKNFYGYNDVIDGIRLFYKEFEERLKADDKERNKHIRVLLVDEYSSLIKSQDRATSKELLDKIGLMLNMGRELGMYILIGMQRADNSHFMEGARDQFRQVLALGRLSREQKTMLFTAEDKERMSDHSGGVGEGYLLIEGQGLERVKVAEIKDFNALNDSIRKAMNR